MRSLTSGNEASVDRWPQKKKKNKCMCLSAKATLAHGQVFGSRKQRCGAVTRSGTSVHTVK